MPTYSYPGIYVEEVSTGARPIEAVGTSTAGFVGIAPNAEAHLHEPFGINNWSQFIKEFATKDGVVSTTSTPLSLAVYGFFQNGGSLCYIVNIGDKNQFSGEGPRRGITALEAIDEVAIVAAPGFTEQAFYDKVLEHCEVLGDRFAILDAPLNPPPGEPYSVRDLMNVATTGTPAKTKKGADAATAADPTAGSGLRARMSKRGYGAFYFPWLKVRDPLSPDGTIVEVPPSGHIAGIYARTDAMRGVHKAPANEVVRGALDLTYKVTRAEQGLLNPAGVNCLRLFGTQGILVYGARTLDDAASEWRYLNVRRLFNQLEESIAIGTRWVVFEPNDRTLWKSIRRDISAFLMLQWRQGALMGATPEEAFFVQCDEETNPPEVVDAGQVVTIIGAAPVKPAEFVIFRIGQSAAGAEIETQGGA